MSRRFLYILLLFSNLIFSQLSKVHYLPPITSGPSNADPREQYLYISTPSDSDVNFTIDILGGSTVTGIVSNENPYVYLIQQIGYSSFVQDPSTTSKVTNDKGFIIEADSPVYVSARLSAGGFSRAQAGALVSKGDNALGYIFRIGTFDSQGDFSKQANYLSFFSVMATEDDTTVNLSNNRTAGLVIQNYGTGQFPIENITLDRGESYTVATRIDQSPGDGLIGTLITSDKPVVVNSGSANGSFDDGGARDYGIDQIVGLEKVGNEYIFVRGAGYAEIENVLIVAHENDTEIYANGTFIKTIDSGEYHVIEGDYYNSNGNLYVNTSKKCFAYQGVGGTDSEANQGMFFVPPLSCGSRGDVDNIPEIDKIGNRDFNGGITVVTKIGAKIFINDNEPSGPSVFGPFAVTGNSNYETYKITGLSGNISVKSTDELYVSYFNFNGSAASGSFFSGFASDPDINVDLNASKLGSCISLGGVSNVTLTVENDGNFDSLQWTKKNSDGTFSDVTGENSLEFSPKEVGTYRVEGTIQCDGENIEYFSSEIPVSQCPNDSDGDGIIDNIDLDLDNDGILNSIESKGIGTIDFTLPGNPTVTLEDGTIYDNLINGITGISSDEMIFAGDNNSFEMRVKPGVDNELSYELSFIEALNINIKDNPNNSSSVRQGESFIIKCIPESANITLLDPNNNILIDSDFNGEYEDNITEYTSNEIRFKFNPDTNSNLTYEFFSSKISGITFKHYYSTTTETEDSVFSPNVFVYDYKNDSDNDTNEDMYEIDSDDDGCNDVIEAGFDYSGFEGDPDSDGILGNGLQTFDNGKIDERGRIKSHNYSIEPQKNTSNDYLFQVIGNPVSIIDQPLSKSGCVGSTVDFEINASSDSNIFYQWQFYESENDVWSNLDENAPFSGTNTSKLTITNIASTNEGQYRVLLKNEDYLCEVASDPDISLSVNLAPDDPIVAQIQTFCQTDAPKISDLIAQNDSSNLTLRWYESEDSAIPINLSSELEHNTFYYAEFIDEEGCVSTGRTPTKAFISNPILSASNDIICSGENTILTIENIAKTASDFAKENNLIFITNNNEPVTYKSTTYGKTYFLIQAGTGQSGFNPIDWTTAKNLTDNFNSGDSSSSARMYVVVNAEMEKSVHDGLKSMGLTYDGPSGPNPDNIYFWLGLYQEDTSVEPGNRLQNYAGWKWVNGQDLKDTYSNWYNDELPTPGEPNNVGGAEHYAQFEFDNNGIKWNDMSIGNGQSWPLFEYTGSSDIVWGYYDSSGKEVEIPDISTTSLDVEGLTETRTYFVKVTTNDIECKAEKTITVNDNPNALQIDDYEFCDNNDDGDGNNGSITLTKTDFEALIPSILGSDQADSDYTVTFYTTLDDAISAQSTITFPYTIPTKPTTEPHWSINSTEIFVRVENNTTKCFNADTKFNIIIKPKPIFFETEDIILCDDDRDMRVGGFDLTSRTNDLRSGNSTTDPDNIDNQSADDYTVSYHTSLEDANDLTSSGIENPDDFTIQQDNSQKIYFRIIKTGGDYIGCFTTGEAFNIIVEPLPVANPVTISRQCDGDAGDESQDGLYPFDTSNIQTNLLNGQTNVTTYYYFKDDDDNDVLIGNELPNPFVSGSQIITIQVENNTPQKCYDETTLEFIVDDSPEAYAVVVEDQCDDGPSDTDGYSEFNTNTVTQTLLTNPETNETQSLDDFTVEYQYVDENGSTITASELPNPFNTKTQTVKATITNKLNPSCTISENIQFNVNPLPIIINNLITIKQCDDGEGSENDGVTLHDLTESQLLFSNNYENETFEYYEDENLLNLIENPNMFYNDPLYDEVWVKIISEDGCERITKTQNGSDRLKIEITVGASQISPTFMDDQNTFYSVCDDSPANNQDGISIFSSDVLKEINDKLIASRAIFQEQNIRVTLHTEKNDANTGNNPIDISQSFTNITPSLQEIWARVINIDVSEGDLQCLGFAQVAELYVEPRPVAYPVTIERQCDGAAGDDSQDGIYPFDTSNIITTLLTDPDTGVTQDDSILTITYFNEDGSEIPAADFFPTFETTSQIITIKIDRDPSYPSITNPDGLCSDQTTLEFIVDDTPEIYPVTVPAHCDGDDGNDDRDGFDQFDTSSLTSALLGPDQSLDDYEVSYQYIDEDGNLLSSSELRNPFNTKTQTVTVTITNKLNTSCPAVDTIDFVVNPLPEFTVDNDVIVCLNLPPQPIGVTSAQGNYTYAWEHEDLNGNTSTFPSTSDTILIGVGGTYYVTATTTDGTNCSRTLSISVSESEIASITLDDIKVKDLTSDNNNTITIDTSNLGIGDYEFSLDNRNGPYQTYPYFDQVRPGIHTIYIRDKKDCGIAQIDVSIIGYKKFFTPNGDGIHDKWRILGIRSDFQANSKIYIMDRYGKLIKEMDPVGDGWDGTYLGRPMPQTDYWFRVYLEDGREFKGHFSLIRGK